VTKCTSLLVSEVQNSHASMGKNNSHFLVVLYANHKAWVMNYCWRLAKQQFCAWSHGIPDQEESCLPSPSHFG